MFSHLSLGSLGLPTGCRTSAEICSVVHEGVRRVLGPTGTFVVPTYTYSFTDGEDYDSVTSPSKTGPFPEYFRNASGVIRSNDPIFSVAAEGPEANELIYNLPPSSFGPDCIYERMMKLGGINANFGLDIEFNTFVHFVESEWDVPYRFEKKFKGRRLSEGGWEELYWKYYVRIFNENTLLDLSRFRLTAKDQDLVGHAKLGSGFVEAMRFSEIRSVMRDMLNEDIWSLTKGPAFQITEKMKV